jgi:sulfate-transporting ATPase
MIATALFSQSTLEFALLGMATGAIYALVGLGIVLVFRSSGVLNFAAGATGAAAAYLFYDLRDVRGINWILALALALALGCLLGALTQVLIMRLLRNCSLLAKLIGTLGVMAATEGAIGVIFGTTTRGLPRSILPVRLEKIGQISIPEMRLILIGIVVVLAVILRVVYSRTLFGLATSAVAENRRVASASGWSPTRIELINFSLAGLLSAFAMILVAPIVGLDAGTLALLVIPALAAALVGRFSSFALTLVGALVIGVLGSELGLFQADIAKALSVDTTSLAGLQEVVPLLVILLVTVFSGRARLQRGEVLTRLPLPGSGRVRPGLIMAGVIVAVVMLSTLSANWDTALTLTFCGAILVLSVVVVTGFCGQLSLAQFALAGFGAWVAARFVASTGAPFLLALVVGMLAAVPAGLIVALPALRTRGVNLAVATLALALMISAVIFQNGGLTGGFSGTVVKPPTVFGLHINPVTHPGRYGGFALVVLILSGLVVANLRRGRSGRRFIAVRSNERAAASLGIGVYSAKLFAFGIASAIAALAGVTLGFINPQVQFEQFDALGSINAVLNAVLGGLGYVSGSVVGGLQSQGGVSTQVLNSIFTGSGKIVSWIVIISGVGVLAVLAQSPDGLAALWSRQVGDRIPKVRVRPDRPAPSPVPGRGRRGLSLEVKQIVVRFGGVVALDDVSFRVLPGEVFGLIGPNGAGKTTMLDVMTGFTRQSSGQVVFGGDIIDDWSPERRARSGLARSWQAVELFEEMTLRENLLAAVDRQDPKRFVIDLVHPGRQASSELMNEMVAELELEPYLDRRPSALPQGITRLAGIARAIVTEPSVLLLDEPAAGLDSHERAELGNVIRRVASRLGIAVLVIEHDVSLLMGISHRMAVLDFGRLIASGTPEEVRTNSAVVSAYLGDKATTAVAAITAVVPRQTAGTISVESEVLIEARALKAGYRETVIVPSLDLEVRAGEVVALLGANGAGKTTTVMTLSGDLPALGGEVHLLGQKTRAPFHQRVNAGLGLVSEERTVLMTMSVADNLKVNQGDADYALELFPELAPHVSRRVSMLSGGQQQMLALARALSRRPKVLLADELSFGLGPLVVERLLQAVRRAADEGMGVLLVEQHIHRALEVADRAYLLRRGRIELAGPAADLYGRVGEIEELYLATAGPAVTKAVAQ